MSPAAKKSETRELPFEKALARLEEIVDAMESGDLPLDRMLAHFEEGNTLIRQCGRQLDEVERRIEKLVRKGDDIVTEPFEEAREAEPDSSAETPRDRLL